MKPLTLDDFKAYSFDKKCDVVTIQSNYIMHHYYYFTAKDICTIPGRSLLKSCTLPFIKDTGYKCFNDIRMLALWKRFPLPA